MQAWGRQPTQCIFCAFRRSSGRAGTLRQTRQYSESCYNNRDQQLTIRRTSDRPKSRGSASLFPKRIEFRTSEEEDRKTKGAWHLDLKQASKPPRERLDRQSTENVRRHLPSAMEGAVRKLKADMSRRMAAKHDETGRTEMQELDPDETKWPIFESRIKSIARKMGELGDNQWPKNPEWDRYLLAYKRSLADLIQELYFKFFDISLKPMTTDELRQANSMALDIRYPTEWYSSARSQQRVIHLHVGPTNSGKTYNALKRLQESKNGFYAGPLRLLAHEVYSRFRANGIPCDLITGDDMRFDENEETKVYASTVEMVNTSKEVEVAVIDEIQMMGSEDRGWAWTRAVLGANAKEVHLCGEDRVIPLIRELAASMGDTLHIHKYQRLNPLRAETRSLRGNLKKLKKGDCIVAFSIMQIHQLKRQIELDTGRRCAIVYGGLPPETRAEQADLFNNPDNDYDFLVASDAIGMGINLSVKRIIFNSVSKFNGTTQVQLTIPQIKQIAGRAGRYRSAHQDKNKSSSTTSEMEENIGLVTSLDESDLPIIRRALQTEAPPLRKAGIIPPAEYLEEFSTSLPRHIPFEYLLRKVCQSATIHERFFLCDVRDQLHLARITDEVPGLSIEQRVNICAAPLGRNSPRQADCLRALARAIAEQRLVTVADVPEIPLEILAEEPRPDRSYLESLETLHKCLIMYLWLSYRFMQNLRDQPMAIHAKGWCEEKINWTLRAYSANPKLRMRLQRMRRESERMMVERFGTGASKEGAEGEAEVIDEEATMPAQAYDGQEGDEGEEEQDEEIVSEHHEDLLEDLRRDGGVVERPPQTPVELDEQVTDEMVDGEPVIAENEAQEVCNQLREETELKPDPADADPETELKEGDVPVAKGQKGEAVHLEPDRRLEEGYQPRAAAVSS